MKAFTEPLLSLAGFEEMTKTAEKSSGLISVTGCIDAQKSQMIYAFGGHRKNKLIVTFGEQKAKELLDNLAEVGILNVKNEKYREQEYKDCISSFCPENWVKVLKTLYSRTKRRGSMTSMDKKYQMLLEHALSSEMNYVLGIPAGEMTELIKKSE